jgi:hypothetical protein
MALGTNGVRYHTQQTHYVAVEVTDADTGNEVIVGKLPPNAYVIGGGIVVGTAFTGGTPTINIGTSDDADGFGSAVSVSSVGFKTVDDLATSNDVNATGEVTVTATLSASLTAGKGLVFIEFIPVDPAVAAS